MEWHCFDGSIALEWCEGNRMRATCSNAQYCMGLQQRLHHVIQFDLEWSPSLPKFLLLSASGTFLAWTNVSRKIRAYFKWFKLYAKFILQYIWISIRLLGHFITFTTTQEFDACFRFTFVFFFYFYFSSGKMLQHKTFCYMHKHSHTKKKKHGTLYWVFIDDLRDQFARHYPRML